MGKLVWDTMRGVDFLLTHDTVDPSRLGVSGNSLGGAKAGWMAALETRLSFAIVSGWAFAPATETWGIDLDITPLRREQFAVLSPGEIGNPEYTIEGWLEQIERNAKRN